MNDQASKPDSYDRLASGGITKPATNFWGPAVILLAALIAVTPQLVRGNTCGHDFDFHLVSWFDTLQSWRDGIFYPHWSPSANFNAGEPRFIFYPPLSWMLSAFFALIFPWTAVPVALTCLFLTGTGLGTRLLARQFLSEGPATLAGCVALFSGYALFTAYERSDFGELAGGFWIPLVLLFIFRERNTGASLLRQAFDGSTVPLALVLAGAWLSNAPVGVMACYLLAAVTLLLAVLRRSWAPVIRATAGVTLCLGLCSFYILPAAYEQRWVDMRQILDDPGYKVENNWLFARHADPSLELHDIELLKASAIAATMLSVTLVALFICWRRGRMREHRTWWMVLAVIPALILFLQFPISAFVWNALPKLRFLQFPWRWLVVLQGPMGIFFASAIWVARVRWRLLVLSVCAVFFFAVTGVAGYLFFQSCDEEDAVWAMIDTYYDRTGFPGTDEYTPPYADSAKLAMGLPDACLTPTSNTPLGQGDAGATVQWSPDQKSCIATYSRAATPAKAPEEHFHLAANIPQPGFLVLHLRSYPAWKVRVNGQPVTSLLEREDGLIVVPAQPGPINVTADWTSTTDVQVSRWLSALTVLLTIGLFVFERRQSAPRLS